RSGQSRGPLPGHVHRGGAGAGLHRGSTHAQRSPGASLSGRHFDGRRVGAAAPERRRRRAGVSRVGGAASRVMRLAPGKPFPISSRSIDGYPDMATPTTSAPYRLIYELGNVFASTLELEALLQLVTQKCREVLDAEGASILLLDAGGSELYFPYLADLDPEVARRLAGLKFPATQGIAGEALRSGRALKVDDVSAEPHHYSLIDRHTGLRTRSLLAAPLLVGEQRLGALEVVNARGRAGFSTDDLVLLELLAHSIALALQHATRVDRLQAVEQNLRTELGALRRDLAKQELLADIVGASAEMAEVL